MKKTFVALVAVLAVVFMAEKAEAGIWDTIKGWFGYGPKTEEVTSELPAAEEPKVEGEVSSEEPKADDAMKKDEMSGEHKDAGMMKEEPKAEQGVVSDTADAMKEKAGEAVEKAGEAMEDAGEQMKESGKDMKESVEKKKAEEESEE